MKHSLGKDDVLAIWAAEIKKGKTPWEAYQGTRTEVHAALQAVLPHPGGAADEDPDVHWIRQKIHGTSLWKEADRLVLEAGITKNGEKS